ncbi:hypothetical protein GCM10011367_25910 [Marinicauda pacifica]|jgi:hypothetical protein|uniref:Uncharacterized protein n=1 Tax=Marinicauda pacifica TaxID=1133559 RepID=A0A4V3RZ19_9PROT|nr:MULTISPECIES: hypothetical protein [Marinicauda]TGY92549.1 hypothetical protein E5162_13025 [Marinicauda pacifica]GGE49829.1 hypothetical protein GCM10011367_25910 [Marinicauda pacifica]
MKSLVLTGAALAALGFTGAASAECYAINAESEATPLDGYSLETESNREGLMAPPPVGEDTVGLLCDRATIVPLENDFEILRHSLPLYIRTTGDGDTVRMLSLGYEDGNYVVQMPQGELQGDEREQIIAALEGFNEGEAAINAYLAAQEAEANGETPQ